MSSMSHSTLNTVLIIVGGVIVYYLLFFLVRQLAKSKRNFIPKILDKHIHLAGLLMFIAIISNIALRNFKSYTGDHLYSVLAHAVEIFVIIATGFVIAKVIAFLKDMLLAYYKSREYKDYTMRSVTTKYQLVQRMLNLLITVLVIAAALMTFDEIRRIGNALLASAGVAGIVIGFAAQKSLGTIFAGIQIALTQPIKLDDTIVVEDHFGTVGEITLTYVDLSTWDEKRVIIPINYFLENNTENWTRQSPEVVGVVKVYTDYMLPIEKIRIQFRKWLNDTPLWDKRKSGLLITNADNKTMEVHATMSAKNSDDAFDLEGLIREKLITYIKENYPEMFPTSRIKLKEVNHTIATS